MFKIILSFFGGVIITFFVMKYVWNPSTGPIAGTSWPKKINDTIKLPESFADTNLLINNSNYQYVKEGNYLFAKDISQERGFNLEERPSEEVPVTTLDRYVVNYKEWLNAGTPAGTPYTKQYCYTILKKDIVTLSGLTDYQGIRVYMGIPDKANPAIQTVIFTAFNSTGGDIYSYPGGVQSAIDQASPCPNDCPYKYSDGFDPQGQPIPTKRMLGRISGKDPQ